MVGEVPGKSRGGRRIDVVVDYPHGLTRRINGRPAYFDAFYQAMIDLLGGQVITNCRLGHILTC